jgi:hypothetical protein
VDDLFWSNSDLYFIISCEKHFVAGKLTVPKKCLRWDFNRPFLCLDSGPLRFSVIIRQVHFFNQFVQSPMINLSPVSVRPSNSANEISDSTVILNTLGVAGDETNSVTNYVSKIIVHENYSVNGTGYVSISTFQFQYLERFIGIMSGAFLKKT